MDHKYQPNFRVLFPETISRVLGEAMLLLQSPGVRVGSQEAIELLQSSGATVNAMDGIAQIPEELVLKSLETVPRAGKRRS